MNFGRVLSLAAVTAGLLLIGSESRAASINLPNTANNLQGNSVAFGPPSTTFAFTQVTAGGSQPPVLSGITVNALSGSTSNLLAVPPFGFQLAGSVVSATQGNTSDLLVVYTVTSAVPIVSVTLFATGGAANGGSSLISETLTNGNGNTPDGSFSLVSGQVTFTLPTPTTVLIISKDINANGGSSAGGIASYSDVRNLINTGGVIPEPASVVMLGAGLMGVLGFGLRRTKKTA